MQGCVTEVVEDKFLCAVKWLWQTAVPSKVSVFGWILREGCYKNETLANRSNSGNSSTMLCFFRLTESW